MNVTFCKKCGMHIVWINTTQGKHMPCNAAPVEYWPVKGGSQRIVTPDGRVIACEFQGFDGVPSERGYIPHFGYCLGNKKK